jgi:tetratricopeptide (TPR) repeat protein
MTTPKLESQLVAAPSIASLMGRYLASRQESVTCIEPDLSEVEPHDAATGFRAAIHTTWAETTAVFRLLGLKSERVSAPPEWAAFVASDEVGLSPFAAGFAPQRLRLPTQMNGLQSFGPRISNAQNFSTLRGWVRKTLRSQSATQLLVAAGIATSLGDWSDAESALNAAESLCTKEWSTAWQNQKAAMLWRKGDHQAAISIWSSLPHHGLKCFNLGLAQWQLGQTAEAVKLLEEAADQLPEHSGWSHLARLYATLASI